MAEGDSLLRFDGSDLFTVLEREPVDDGIAATVVVDGQIARIEIPTSVMDTVAKLLEMDKK